MVYEKYQQVEAQKNFIKSAFSKYISPDYVNEILKNPEKLKVGGQRKELTIMFSDIRSFTSFSEKMDAKCLDEFLNKYKQHGDQTIMAFEGCSAQHTDFAHENPGPDWDGASKLESK